MIDLDHWSSRPWPTLETINDTHVTVAAWNATKHGEQLWAAFGGIETNTLLFHFGWPHMQSANDFITAIQSRNDDKSLVTCVFEHPVTKQALGMASYMRIDQANGTIEIGAIAHGSALARTTAATQAHYLMAQRVFEQWGYRRYEWKLNNTNQPSHVAAQRFGFSFEGVFRQAEVKPYGNRDTAWYSMLDREWPHIKMTFKNWLQPDNFKADGMQQTSLQALNARQLDCAGTTLYRADRSMVETATAFQKAAYARTKEVIGTTPIPTQWNYDDVLAQCETWYAADELGWTALLILRPENGYMMLESIATRKDIKGLARPIMDIAIHRAHMYRLTEMHLMTNSKNSAVGWYEKLGFIVTKTDNEADRTVLHMSKAL